MLTIRKYLRKSHLLLPLTSLSISATLLSSGTRAMATTKANTYVPPKVWVYENSDGSGWSMNRPTAGSRFERDLPKGKHPLQLYSMGTPNGQKVTIMLEELLAAGVDEAEYNAWLIRIGESDQFGSGFVAINPNSKIPAMVDYQPAGGSDDPVRIFESGSILLYLADKHGKFLPHPSEVTERTETLNWLFWCQGGAPFVGGGFGHFFRYAKGKQKYPIDRYTMETKRQLDVLNRQLKENEFVAGKKYSIADMAVWPWYGLLVMDKIYDDASTFLNAAKEYPHVIRWAKQIMERPAVKRGFKVNRTWGELSEQLHERHEASDFDTQTENKLTKKE